MTTIAKCRMCGSDGIAQAGIDADTRVKHYVACCDDISCGVTGPWSGDEQGARDGWNKLMQPAPPPEQMTVLDHYICAGIAGRSSDSSLHTAISIGNHAYELSRQK